MLARNSSLLKRLASLVALCPGLAFGLPDFTVGAPQTVTVADSNITFTMEIKNIGNSTYAGSVRVKPFLLPKVETSASIADQAGIVLDYADLAVNIAAGASQVVTYTKPLPTVSNRNYYVAVIVNSNSAVAEVSEKNNVSDLAEAGKLSARAENDSQQDWDLYPEITGSLDTHYGSVAHVLNMNKVGDDAGALVSRDMWARFMAADFTTKKIYTLPYNSTSMDKQWYNFVFYAGTDSSGNAVTIDKYSQAPSLRGVPAGSYRFLCLTNLRDQVPESNAHNNLSVNPMNVVPIRILPAPQVWFTSTSDAKDVTMVRRIQKVYRPDLHWKSDIDANASWLSVSPASGVLTAATSSVDVTFTAKPMSLTPGTYYTVVTFTGTGLESSPLKVPVTLTVKEKGDVELHAHR